MTFSSTIRKIRGSAVHLERLCDDKIRLRSQELQFQAMSGTRPSKLLVPAYALVLEASRRTIGQSHYDVQLLCGIEMARGKIAEMKTGEGKTLTAGLIAYLLAIRGRGMHLVTFNDYLARRDREYLQPVFELLGITTAVLTPELPKTQRRAAYRCGITYGTAKEFGFDFLRDRLAVAKTGDPNSGVMRGTHYALIDEADSILIDESRTPLIIGVADQAQATIDSDCYQWAAQHAAEFVENTHYTRDRTTNVLSLNFEGIKKARSLTQNDGTRQVSIRQLYKYLENAIKVRHDFIRDKNYAVRDGEAVIIDEFTGRPAEGRQWQDGVHQSVQAKEGIEITTPTRQAASITIQSFFRRYEMFSGMTGTVSTSRREIKKVYSKSIARIPTHRPTIRSQMPTRVFASHDDKFAAISDSAKQHVEGGRSLLIGVRSVELSQRLADVLTTAGITFHLLNAKHLEREADIIAESGKRPGVTVATNMAGRGTDIKLADEVRAAGGLHVILTELHESERIDWQLIGRSSRQGDPGSYQIFVSLEDEILVKGLGPDKARRIAKRFAGRSEIRLLELFPLFRKAQQRTEKKHLIDRLILLKQDQEKQKVMFESGKDPFLNVVRD